MYLVANRLISSVVKMSSIELTVEHQKLLDRIAVENNFARYQAKATTGSEKGENYLGVLTSVTIEDGKKKLDMMLKTAPVGEYRKQMPIREAYLREIFIYEQVFPRFDEFQKEFGISDPFRSHAKIYGSCDAEFSECLFLEDLRSSGFGLWNRKVPMNHDHIAAVIKEYAKFHAVSLAMRDKKPEDFKRLTKQMEKHTFEEYMTDKDKTAMYTKSVLDNIWVIFENDSSMTDILRRFEKLLPSILSERDNMVIGHGDCWCNNLLFSYKGGDSPTTPSHVKIIDWQVSNTSTPAYDLAYFFLVHSPKDILYNYESYMKLYHDTLSKNLQEFGCDIEQLYPHSALLEDWNKKVKMALFMSFMILKMMMCDAKDAPNFIEICDSGEDMLNFLDFASKDTNTYSRRIKDLVEFCVAKGYL